MTSPDYKGSKGERLSEDSQTSMCYDPAALPAENGIDERQHACAGSPRRGSKAFRGGGGGNLA